MPIDNVQPDRDPPQHQLSDNRVTQVWIGRGISAVGLLIFFSNFLVFASFADQRPKSPFEGESYSYTIDANGKRTEYGRASTDPPSMGGMVLTALLGMGLVFVGKLVSDAGKLGAAGSGIIIDPVQARKDLEPFSRQKGGMLKDSLDEAGINLGGIGGATEKVMVKCRECRHLNEEDSKFCQECGKAI